MSEKKRILLTNDDGYAAAGIAALYEALCPCYDVTVIAPELEQSGVGHAFSYNNPLYYRQIPARFGIPGYIVSGTPSDCVKFGVVHIMESKPDIVVSGMNVGENSGISVFYSGTVAGAREGAFWQIPSVAFSLSESGSKFLSEYTSIASDLLEKIIKVDKRYFAEQTHNRVFFNVNFPSCSPGKSKGIRVTRQSLAFYDDRYVSRKTDEGTEQFWLTGEKRGVEESESYDSRALDSGYITITPLNCDATSHAAIEHLAALEKNRLRENAS